MTTVNDVPAEPLVLAAAAQLQSVEGVSTPDWAQFARTGRHTERAPEQEGWWYIRCAAVLRKVYLNGPIGTERLSALFGGAKDRGSKPNRATKGSRKVIRVALQQLEAAGMVEAVDGGGRRVTAAGQKFLDNVAHEVRPTIEGRVAALSKY